MACPVVAAAVNFLVAFDTDVVVAEMAVVACADSSGDPVAAACATTKCYRVAAQPRRRDGPM